ncbi:MAG: FAD-binding oxidoreductase [Phycisphaerales bacterium]|nr:FAD-binding oxidoreductase [Phycisphaerales bacterium]
MPPGPSNQIAIIGAGVVGLTTALELRARQTPVAIYAPRSGRSPASRIAPALFTPYSMPDGDRFERWTTRSLAKLTELAWEHGDHSGIHIGELREYFYKPAAHYPWLDRVLAIRPLPGTPSPCIAATTSTRPHMDMLRYMPWLEARASESGVEFVDRRVESFDDLFALGHKTIINCAGLGARELAQDPLLKPMHGQVIHIPNDIGLEYSLHDDAPGGLVAYIFRFRDRLVLGGTFDSGREDDRTDPPALDGIIDRCRNLLRIDGHPRWRDLAQIRIRSLAGVRPTRGMGDVYEHTRVERIDLPGGRAIVQNYGHGRAGASLSWGTAAEAADQALGSPGDP